MALFRGEESDDAEAGAILLARLGTMIDQHLSRPPPKTPSSRSPSRLRRR